MEIREFNNIDELLEETKNDKESTDYIKDRFPIRFIFFPNKDIFKEFIKKMINTKNVKLKFEEIPMSCYLTSEDVIKFINSKIEDDKDLLIVPVSEIARFYDSKSFSSLFQQLSEIEFRNNKNKVRIYIPIIGLYSRFEKEFLKNFSREEWAPIWKLNSIPDKKINGYCLNIELNYKKVENLSDNYTIIRTFEDWGNLWKKEETKDILSLCEEINYLFQYFQPDSFFNFENIDTYDKFLEKILKINIPIPYNDKEKEFWRELIEHTIMNNIRNFKELIQKTFKKIEVLYDDIIELWVRGNKFQRWLLKWCVLINKNWENKYLYKVLEDIDRYDDISNLELSLWLKIFDISVNKEKEIFDERRKLIKMFYNLSMRSPKNIEPILKEKFSKVSNLKLKQKIRYLTDLTQFEKEQIILCLIQGLRNNELTKNEILELLREIYPNLYYYLGGVNFSNLDEENRWVIGYFNEYKWSKVLDEVSNGLLNILNEKNKDENSFAEWYWKFKTSKDILAQIEKDEHTKIVWIDGLGVEFASLIKNIVNNSENYFIEDIFIGRTELPSITELNKFECEKINDLDKYIHKQNPYRHPKCIVEEVDIVNGIIKNILGSYDKIIIVSDHGFTPFALKRYGNVKKYDFEAGHEGRYVWLDTLGENVRNNIKDNNDYIRDPNNRALVALKYTSLGDIPRREVHGGATPEEVLVPIIVISKDKDKINYEISYKRTILVKNPILYLDITPYPKYNPYVIFKNQRLDLSYDNSEKKWFVNLPTKKPEKYNLKISIGKFSKDIQIEIKGGMKERDLL
ncbi:BREX-4 system phosphatase PglZ [Methanotorris formicicus]|uniref:DUF7863 domain-containing protein n=1 Tax=Methanotorris formicicus Mc-S-70 TaxID=647171 RepID=H1L1A6_9EURY|nr:BREX-4 system phosphatase PglZ [Methanotorris formicicus]EHP83892.1 hypothetical protein MetfoDRAFT_1830 [Methanotorris formicicus Mc-S-70]